MALNDDLFGDEWEEFESELIEEEFAEEKPKSKGRGRFRFILFLTVVAVGLTVYVTFIRTEEKTETAQWLSETKTVANNYRTELTAEAMDCKALNNDDKFKIPEVPDWANPDDADTDELKQVYELMASAQAKLENARQRMLGICGEAETQPNSNWPPNTIPLTQVDGAIVDISLAETLVE